MITAAWLVHLYTASGVVLAFLAAQAVIDFDFRTAFFWLWLQVVVDATDGFLARRLRVSERIPWFSGSKLDDVVDYLTYVFVPALFVWRSGIVPSGWALLVVSAILLSSAYGFTRDKAKTADSFTGFPSYWNVVALYLLVARWSPVVNATILLGLAIMVFVPIRYVYPSRNRTWQLTTIVFGAIWGGLLLLILWQYPAVSSVAFLASFAFPIYYVLLSLALQFGVLSRR